MDKLGMTKDNLFYSEDKETGIALILVDENTSQNEILIVPGACSTITEEEIKGIEPIIKEAEYVLLQLEVNQDANEMVVEMANRYGCKVIVNTAPYSLISDEFLSKLYMVTPNEVEAEELTGVHVTDLESAKKAAKYFHDKGVKKVIITLGSIGVFVSSDQREEIVPAFHVNAIDTTGAGDAFNGGLLAALSEGKDIWEAVRFSNALAALSVQRLGTTPSMPTREEINVFLKEH
jgi:ribokinase